jgi:hypothetical protein
MTVDIFEFWSAVDPAALIHPTDKAVFDRIPDDGFDITLLTGWFMGTGRSGRGLFLQPFWSGNVPISCFSADAHDARDTTRSPAGPRYGQ